MGLSEQLEMVEDRAVFRPIGEVVLSQAVRMVTSAIVFAREHHIRKLLINTTGLTGFAPPNIANRYFFIQEWASASGGFVQVAIVARLEMIDPQKFGVTVAANHGLLGEVFITEQEASAWLDRLH